MVIGALEAGGTKMVCATGDENGNIVSRVVFPTESPERTVPKMISYFLEQKVEALGIGCFGPLNLHKNSESYGTITTTPKESWRQFAIVKEFEDALKVPVALDTDVNAAALGEAVWGAGTGDEIVLYITIGTGIGVGISVNGQLLHGLVHPEAGHILLAKQEDDHYEGKCPFHKNCFEGLASGPAIEGRWGASPKELSDKDSVWEMESDYIAQALADYILVYSPNRIILGGGVMHQKKLYPMILSKTMKYLNGYIKHQELDMRLNQYIVSPGLGEDSGIMGALKLAIDQIRRQ